MDINQLQRKHRAALTRARKLGPEAVIKACDQALAEFDKYGWPDSWADWERAKSDALSAIKYGR